MRASPRNVKQIQVQLVQAKPLQAWEWPGSSTQASPGPAGNLPSLRRSPFAAPL